LSTPDLSALIVLVSSAPKVLVTTYRCRHSTHTHTYTHTQTNTHTHTHTHVSITNTHTYIHTREYYTHTHTYTHRHTHTHTYAHVIMCVIIRIIAHPTYTHRSDLNYFCLIFFWSPLFKALHTHQTLDMADIFLDMLLPKSKFLKGVGRASANIFSSENALGVCVV
jgi:hypothetical protein